jgi:CO/xanthine dehydrogenase Mo-binding subunit
MSITEGEGSIAKTEHLKTVGTRPIRPDGVDKVTGRARFGADLHLPGMLYGRTLRSPHAHARILSIDTSKAEALAGVKAVVTRDDFPEMPSEMAAAGEMMINYRDVTRNVMAREKALYDGHAVAAVAATSELIARRALDLIEVEYEVLDHVIDVVEAMKPDAPLLHEDQMTQGADPTPDKPSNIAKRLLFEKGDIEQGFNESDRIIEREFTTKPVHQGYIEPQACVASTSEDGSVDLWCSTQGHFIYRAQCAKLLGLDIAKLRVTASEIGGGFGGKNNVYGEPVAIALSRKSRRPVRMVMSRDEVFRATGPTSGAHIKVKLGCRKDGTITAAQAEVSFQAGAFAGSSIAPACMCAFTRYDLENVHVIGHDVVVNRPKVAAYRAPGAPITAFAVESVLDEMAKTLGIDPLAFRLKNAAREGTQTYYGPTFEAIGYVETVEAALAHEHYAAPLGEDQGRGVASGFWFNIGGETSTALNISEDGTVALTMGMPDVAGGSRAAMAMMVAEELGIDVEKVRPEIGDTGTLGFNFITAGSRGTFAGGVAAVAAAREAIEQLCKRAAMIWDVPADGVIWEDGHARPASSNVGEFEPLSLAEIAAQAGKTGGPIAGHGDLNVKGAGPGFGTHIVDVEVDRETGRIEIKRYTVLQDAGQAIHPGYVAGQYQGGAVQGIGWALNEEYIYGPDGRLQNPGFLDYRMPVASDVPMIDTVIIEVPNPNHPYGVRGIGEVPIIPPLAAIANAVEDATGIRFTELPLSPPRVLKALKEAEEANGSAV